MRQQFNQKMAGFTLVEVILALGVLSFGVIGVYAAFSPIVAQSYNLSTRLTAAYLAQEGMEIMRNIRDENFVKSPAVGWSDGIDACLLGCQADYKTGTSAEGFDNQLKVYNSEEYLRINDLGFYSYDASGTTTPFKRKITVTSESSDVLKVDVEVFWDYNRQPYSFKTSSYLYNWY